MRILLLTALVLTPLVALGCGRAREPSESFNPSWSPDGRTIAYVVDPDPSAGCSYGSCAWRYELWALEADGGKARKLARGVAGGLRPLWSPDGRTIAFEHFRLDAGPEIYSIHADGTGRRRLTNTPWEQDWPAAWSPDGSKLLYIFNQLYVMQADGSGRRRLTRLEPYEASWSPDGTRIAFTTFDGLFAIGADGRGLKKLYGTEHGDAGGIGWLPDGRRIAFGVEGRFAVVDATTGRVLARPPTGGYRWDVDYEMDASWSPDRQAFAYGRPEGGIDLVAANGSTWKRLAAAGSEPCWSPDGRRIAFAESGDIYVMKIDGSGRRKLTERLPARPE